MILCRFEPDLRYGTSIPSSGRLSDTHPPDSASPAPYKVLFNAKTDVGKVRPHNEDNFLIDRKLKLYVVCDGMGGHLGGEIASATAVNVVREVLLRGRPILEGFQRGEVKYGVADVLGLIEDAVVQANRRIFERSNQNADQRGMGTTLTLMLVGRHLGFVAHVGDTRVYRRRGGKLTQLTEDHSLVNEMARTMNMPAESFDDRLKNAITRAVGVHDSVEVDTFHFPMQPGDRYLVCSDGLHGLVEDAELSFILDEEDLGACVGQMIDRANGEGGKDNITAILLEIAPGDVASTSALSPVDALARSPICHRLSEPQRERLVKRGTLREVTPTAPLTSRGSSAPGLCVIVDGELRLLDGDVEIGVLKRGDHLGEESLFVETSSRLNAGARDGQRATVLVVDRECWAALQLDDPTLAGRLAVSMASSLARRMLALSFERRTPTAKVRRPFTNPTGERRPDTGPRPRTSDRVFLPTAPQVPVVRNRRRSQPDVPSMAGHQEGDGHPQAALAPTAPALEALSAAVMAPPPLPDLPDLAGPVTSSVDSQGDESA